MDDQATLCTTEGFFVFNGPTDSTYRRVNFDTPSTGPPNSFSSLVILFPVILPILSLLHSRVILFLFLSLPLFWYLCLNRFLILLWNRVLDCIPSPKFATSIAQC